MTEQVPAEEHLRVIRGLMERATIYRAISAPTALVGGVLSLLLSGLLVTGCLQPDSDLAYVAWWVSVLLLTVCANTCFIYLDAKRRSEPFISSGMRLALCAIAPSLLLALVLTVLFVGSGAGSETLPLIWSILYGLALLATAPFAPRSIAILGWVFLLAGICAMVGAVFAHVDLLETSWVPSAWMGVTFGGFHLVYAACVWPRRKE